MKIMGMEKMSLVDFDGYVSATLFTGGCNFSCPFCHNAPLVKGFNDLPYLAEKEVFDYLEKRRGILDGVCITGGEPTLHPDLPILMEKIKNLGYKVKLDTNGTNPELVKTIDENGLCDYFAMDIKNDRESYAKIIGFDSYDTKKVEQTVDYFLSKKANYEFRTTLINEFHKKQNIVNIAEWIKGANKYFLQKFKLGENCLNADNLSPVDNQTTLEYLEILRKSIPSVSTRGYDF
ncbi:MAG: anaerobic ribonucleoside-triphosphate reductase activating protein [Clostridia bacterium]|nr:anaerobic ribonucleoside-triphosphate reductase activating protein [Clostridia bacterium]